MRKKFINLFGLILKFGLKKFAIIVRLFPLNITAIDFLNKQNYYSFKFQINFIFNHYWIY